MNFVQLLYVLLIYHISGNAKLAPEAEAIIEEARTASSMLLSMSPYIGDAIELMEKGESIDLMAMSICLTEMITQYQVMPKAHASFVEVVSVFAKWFKNQNASSHTALAKIVARCKSSYIRSMITEGTPDQGNVQKSLKSICAKLGFKNKSALTPDECNAAKAQDPELYKEYLAMRRQHAMSWKTALSNYVKTSGKEVVPCQKALAYLASYSIEHSMPTGFTGGIDAEGNWYTKSGEMLGNVPKAPVFTTITMKSAADGDASWICKANKPGGGYSYVYTKAHNEASWQHKYLIANALIKNIEKYRRKWLANIKNPFKYAEVNAVASLVIELLYLSSDRAGSVAGGSEGGQGFGMCSILCKHVTVRTNGSILISYKGKDAVQFKFQLMPGNAKDKIICEVIAQLLVGKSPKDPVFSTIKANQDWKPVSYSAITSYFKSLTGGANIHKLRTIAGTGLFNTEAQRIQEKMAGKTITEKTAVEIVISIATKVGKKLGHIKTDAQGNISTQPMTSLKNYIDFASQMQFFEFFGLPVPAYLEKLTKTNNDIKSSVVYADGSAGEMHLPKDIDEPEATEKLDKAADPKQKPVSPIVAPTDKKPVTTPSVNLKSPVKVIDVYEEVDDDEGNEIDQTGGPSTKRLAVRFLEGIAQDDRSF